MFSSLPELDGRGLWEASHGFHWTGWCPGSWQLAWCFPWSCKSEPSTGYLAQSKGPGTRGSVHTVQFSGVIFGALQQLIKDSHYSRGQIFWVHSLRAPAYADVILTIAILNVVLLISCRSMTVWVLRISSWAWTVLLRPSVVLSMSSKQAPISFFRSEIPFLYVFSILWTQCSKSALVGSDLI